MDKQGAIEYFEYLWFTIRISPIYLFETDIALDCKMERSRKNDNYVLRRRFGTSETHAHTPKCQDIMQDLIDSCYIVLYISYSLVIPC